uniref:iron-containing alcohol dehydrogenase n=1 Tax=Nonomuraea rhizosphaerae TaxID=2665663 RepID=UPI001C5D0395
MTDITPPPVTRFSFPTRVITGPGGFEALGPRAAAFGARALLVTDGGVRRAGLVEPIEASLKAAGVETAIFDDVASDPSIQAVEGAVAAIHQHAADVVVAVGGGSPIDTAKAATVVAAGGGS